MGPTDGIDFFSLVTRLDRSRTGTTQGCCFDKTRGEIGWSSQDMHTRMTEPHGNGTADSYALIYRSFTGIAIVCLKDTNTLAKGIRSSLPQTCV